MIYKFLALFFVLLLVFFPTLFFEISTIATRCYTFILGKTLFLAFIVKIQMVFYFCAISLLSWQSYSFVMLINSFELYAFWGCDYFYFLFLSRIGFAVKPRIYFQVFLLQVCWLRWPFTIIEIIITYKSSLLFPSSSPVSGLLWLFSLILKYF